MNPNMLNRRSMLTGGTFISLSTLLAACVPHDITTAGDGSTASGTPATNSSPSSSAGNGEYRKPQYSQANKSSMQKRASSSAGEARERSLHGSTRSKGSSQSQTKSQSQSKSKGMSR